MSDLTNKQNKQLDYLLADYNAVKSEISRRSNLQRIALAAYIALLAFVFKEAPSSLLTSLHIVLVWFSSAITLNYFVRQGKEINRLGEIISRQIEPIARSIISIGSGNLLPSETNPQNEIYNRITATYNFQFKWALFFVVPIFVTLLYLGQDWNKLSSVCNFYSRAPYMTAISIFFGVWAFILLCRHVNEKMHNKLPNQDD